MKINDLIVKAIINSIWDYMQERDCSESIFLRFIEAEITDIIFKYKNTYLYPSYIKRMSQSLSTFILNQYDSLNNFKKELTIHSAPRVIGSVMPPSVRGFFDKKKKEVLKEKFFGELEQYIRELYAEFSSKKYQEGSVNTLSGNELYKLVKLSVVGIETNEGIGSGVFFNADGMIATNKHVIGNTTEVTVRFHNSEEFHGKVIHSFRDIDLAFVKVFLSEEKIIYPKISNLIEEGQTIYAIGHPEGLVNTITKGTISSIGRILNKVKYIQHDAAINQGNSGGPLFNENAELIGINTLKYTNTDGLGFALPAKSISEKYILFQTLQGKTNSREYCPVCGYSSMEHSKYCENCGANLELYPKNSKPNPTAFVLKDICSCGQKRYADEKYCKKCGQVLLIYEMEK